MGELVRTFVQSDDPIVKAGIEAHLGRSSDVARVADASSADVALLAVERLDAAAIATARSLRCEGAQVVVVCSELDDRELLAVVEAGVIGILRRDRLDERKLTSAIASAGRGEPVLGSDLVGRLFEHVRQLQGAVLAPRRLHFSGLSHRELEVLRLVADGHETREIAAELSYSERTIKNVLQDVTRRFGLRNRSHAVAYALREGLI